MRRKIKFVLKSILVVSCLTTIGMILRTSYDVMIWACSGNVTALLPRLMTEGHKPTCAGKPVVSDKSVDVSYEVLSFAELTGLHGNNLETGGHFRPPTCEADQKVAIVIPYRDRENNLKMLLNNLHPFLKKQNIDYQMFVAEQLPGTKFNRGMIKNIGFVEAMKIRNFDCVFFHDVDMTPDNLGNIYRCGDQPRLHSTNLARWGNKPSFTTNFGGVVSMKAEQLIKVNGYSNSFFQWGCEDDELKLRFEYHKINTTQYPFNVSSYQEFQHKKQSNPETKLRYSQQWYRNWRSRLRNDGLTSLYYEVKKIIPNRLYTHFYVAINMTAMSVAYNGRLGGLNRSTHYSNRKNLTRSQIHKEQ